jgi:hypothetical protein
MDRPHASRLTPVGVRYQQMPETKAAAIDRNMADHEAAREIQWTAI